MNNLFVMLLAGAVGLTLFSSAQRSITESERSITAQRQQANIANAKANEARSELRRLEKLFVSEQQSVRKLRAEVSVDAPEESVELDWTKLTPQKEGFWPGNKPYFYISKSHLKGLSYWPFASGDRLSQTAVTLFGMSGEEEQAANEAYATLREQIRRLEVAHATPTNPPPWIDSWPGEKKSLFIEPVSKEIINGLDGEFMADLTQAIGPERAELLARRINEETVDSGYGLAQARTLTLIRNGDEMQLATSYGNGNTMSGKYKSSDGRFEVPPEFRHLFPQE